jgi:hypothetical protein
MQVSFFQVLRVMSAQAVVLRVMSARAEVISSAHAGFKKDSMACSDPTTTIFRVSADNEYSAKYYCRIFGRQRQNRQIEKWHFEPKITPQQFFCSFFTFIIARKSTFPERTGSANEGMHAHKIESY